MYRCRTVTARHLYIEYDKLNKHLQILTTKAIGKKTSRSEIVHPLIELFLPAYTKSSEEIDLDYELPHAIDLPTRRLGR